MNSPVLNNWSLRPAHLDDLDGVCDVIDAYSLDLLGVGADNRKYVVLTWEQPGFRLDQDTRVAVTPEGRIVGYGEVEDTEAPHVRAGSWIRVHPEFKGRGIEAALLAWIEERAEETIAKAPSHAQVILTHGINDQDTDLQALFKQNGFRIVRHFWRMVIDLECEIPAPQWPDGITVRTLILDEDLEAMVRAYRDSFCDHWGHVDAPFEEDLKQWDHWIRNDPEFDETLTFLAMAGDEIVGLSSCEPRDAEDQATGHIDILGVTRSWRRRGIALALLRHTFREFKQRGQKRVSLGVDAASLTGAVRLYELAGMKMARQFDAFEKELRAGEDLSLRTLEARDAAS
ncbi:GNAT family N-acetyltransferase [Candidatus Bipolaricaulota bacterium]|nr:GNAT family N-acetyltransferase [Candidatus Bipolaricaulota bacterium]